MRGCDPSKFRQPTKRTLQDDNVNNPVLLLRNETAARYTPADGGRVLFVRNDNLYSQKVNLQLRKLEGEPELTVKGVASQPGLDIYRADFAVSRSGVVVFRPGAAALVSLSKKSHCIRSYASEIFMGAPGMYLVPIRPIKEHKAICCAIVHSFFRA